MNDEKIAPMMTPIKGLVHVCTVCGDDGWEAMCCLWDGDRWLFWEDAFDPPEWSPVTDINCVVEAWDLPIMPGSPVYRNKPSLPAIPDPAVVVEKVRAALEQIRHSMHQAMIPGNDKTREIALSGQLADEALASLTPAGKDVTK